MKRFIPLVLCLLVGCQGFMRDDAEIRIGFETAVILQHIGPKDADKKSLIGIDFMDWAKKPLVDWIVENQQSPGDEVIEELNGE